MLMQRKEIINKYWEAGFSLIPISRKKVPCLKGWQNTSVGQYIKESDFPENIGVVLQGNDLVIDVDPRHFKEADNPFKRLKQDIGCDFKDTLVVETGRGGIHIYLKNPADTLLRASHPDYPGIDFKKKGGFVVAAGSIHGDTGKTYKIINGDDFNIMEAPSRLLELLMKDKVDFSNLQKLNGYCDSKQTISRFIERLKNTQYYISGGSTPPKVFETACLGKDYGLSPQVALDLMNKHWNLKPGRSYEDIKYKVACAYKYGANPIGCKNPRADFTSVTVDSVILGSNQEKWQDPIPFDDYSKLPEFPTEILPEIGREMVEAVSKVNQVDKGLPGSMYLAALSTCLSKKCQVDLGTHTEPVNIYTCPILDPGERKSTTMNLMMNPIYKYQKDMIWEVIDDEDPPVYVVDDITSEALFQVMSENNECMSVISAEGGVFGIMAGRYNGNGKGNIDVYLKGHAGDPCSNHRIGRRSQSMNSPSLTICLAVQRDIIREIGVNRQFRGRGLLARFLYSNCTHKAGYRRRQKEAITSVLKQEYREHILELMRMPLNLHNLELSPEVQNAWDEFYNNIETEMQAGGQMASIKDWGSKLPGAVARIAGLLHFAEHGQQAKDKTISVDIVNASMVLGVYYKKHALATFGFMGEDSGIESAKKILEYLIHHKPDSFKGRDILRNKNYFNNMRGIFPGLILLMERNYIREAKMNTTGIGRPESTIYEVNPRVKKL